MATMSPYGVTRLRFGMDPMVAPGADAPTAAEAATPR